MSEGLKKNEKCICLTNPNQPSSYYRFLEGNLARQEMKPNQLVFMDAAEVCLNKDRFEPLQMIIAIIGQLVEVSLEGYESTRFVLDMGWTSHNDWGLLECEALFNKYVIPCFDCAILCGYNPEKLNPRLFREIALSHPRLMFGDQVIDNQAYTQLKPFWFMPRAEVMKPE